MLGLVVGSELYIVVDHTNSAPHTVLVRRRQAFLFVMWGPQVGRRIMNQIIFILTDYDSWRRLRIRREVRIRFSSCSWYGIGQTFHRVAKQVNSSCPPSQPQGCALLCSAHKLEVEEKRTAPSVDGVASYTLAVLSLIISPSYKLQVGLTFQKSKSPVYLHPLC